MKVLLIEDNEDLCTALQTGLQPDYIVDTVHTGKEGGKMARIYEYDVVVLDVHLPDIDGLEVCREIRNKRPDTPILILTIVTDERQKVRIFDAGADDYVVKPITIEELKARLRALMRRRSINQPEEGILRVGDLTLDVARHTVFRGKKQIKDLRPRAFNLLEYLMRNKEVVLSRGEILEHVWETDAESFNNTVDVHIKYLRDKVDRPFKNGLIKTVPGFGYKIEGPESKRKKEGGGLL